MSEMGKVVYLSTSTYAGIVGGAYHYYGTLKCGRYDPVTLKRTLTESGAAKLNRNDRDQTYVWKEGHSVIRFEDEESLIAVAIEEWKDRFPDAVLLLLGSNCVADPQPILDCTDDDLRARLEPLYERARELDWWESGDPEMDEVADEWWAILKELRGDG